VRQDTIPRPEVPVPPRHKELSHEAVVFSQTRQSRRKKRQKNDHTRRLSQKGKEDIKKIAGAAGKRLKKIDCFMASRAVRARKTAALFAKKFDYPEEKILIEETLYPAGEPTPLLQALRACDSSLESICLVGHAPQLDDAVRLLAEEPREPLPPGAILGLEFDASTWDESVGKKGKVIYFDFPGNKAVEPMVKEDTIKFVADKVAEAVKICLAGLSSAPDKKTGAVIKKYGREVAEVYCRKQTVCHALTTVPAQTGRGRRSNETAGE
jgi:phosphohistidine phosphatase